MQIPLPKRTQVKLFNDVITLEDVPFSKSPRVSPRPLRTSQNKILGIYRSQIRSPQSLQQTMLLNYSPIQTQIDKRSKSLARKKHRMETYRLPEETAIHSYVRELTRSLEGGDAEKIATESKFKALQKILEYYDIKNLEKNDYSKLIRTFGLKIETAATSLKTKRYSPPKMMTTHKPHTSFGRATIKEQDKLFTEEELMGFQNLKLINKNQLGNECRGGNVKYRIKKRPEDRDKLFNSLGQKSLKPRPHNLILDKVNKYKEFLFILNFSNHMYRNLEIESYEKPLKFYIGKGNNSNLLKALMKKRFWFEEVNSTKFADFVWTQLKNEKYLQKQENPKEQSLTETEVTTSKPLKKYFVTNQKLKQQSLKKILSTQEIKLYLKIPRQNYERSSIPFSERMKLIDRQMLVEQDNEETKCLVHNHLPTNGILGNKKAMFLSLQEYCRLVGKQLDDLVPLTLHIRKGVYDSEYTRFTQIFQARKAKQQHNYWVVKPGEFSNRGNGIFCCSKLQDIHRTISKSKTLVNNQKQTYIIQQYIQKPLLYNGRKFDLRVFMLITTHNGKLKAYWYQQGYVRTSSHYFNLQEINDSFIHLTNDAIQKTSDDYSKFEQGNKITFSELQRNLDSVTFTGSRTFDLSGNIIPKMKTIAAEAVRSTYIFHSCSTKMHNFELFGLDFMVDERMKPWLIEINTNPCLQLSCPILQRIVPHMLQNMLRIAVDPIFPPPAIFGNNYKYSIPENALHYNKFQLIFDGEQEGPELKKVYADSKIMQQIHNVEEDKEEYGEEGAFIDISDV